MSDLFTSLEVCPDDPILQLMVRARNDTNPLKVDLSVGIYKNDVGKTPVMNCVKAAEKRRTDQEDSKAYLGLAGDLRFNKLVTELALGANHSANSDGRVSTIQTTGGSGAIRIASELIKRIKPGTKVWVSNPTWANHIPILKSAGLEIATYSYYQPGERGVRFAEMMQELSGAQHGDVILLQGSCHNPCGEDLSLEQWWLLTNFVLEKGLLPFVDIAYHGLSQDLDQDSLGWRHMAASVPEMLICYSGSKNFSLYRDRVGVLISVSPDQNSAHILLTNMMSISRVVYSLPPAHGGYLVAEILEDFELRQMWMSELDQIRLRINTMRTDLADALLQRLNSDRFEFIRDQQGMFSFLGISAEQVLSMRESHGIYLLNSSRINIAGITSTNLEHIADAVASVI